MPHLQLTLSDLLSRLEAFWMESKEGCSAHLLASVTCAAKQKIAGHKYQKTAAGDFTPLTDSPSHPLNYFSLSARRKKPSNISLSSNHPCPLRPPEFLFSADDEDAAAVERKSPSCHLQSAASPFSSCW